MRMMSVEYGFRMVCLFFLTSHTYAQLSPGELSKAHAHLEGLTNCTQCHVLNEKETTSKCMECHTEIKSLMDLGRGYHGSAEVKGKKCAQCHGEHFGRNFDITRFATEQFDHDLSGYKLEGKHAHIGCADCHKPGLITNDISKKSSGISYLGLGTGCLSCHEDFHQNTLSSNCTSCHNQDVFKPAPGFNHGRTNYPLIGKHQMVDCVKCHPRSVSDEREFQEFVDVEHANCTNCHADVHNNKLGKDCKKCHSEYSFRQVKGMDAFNHDLSNFPLRGKHLQVDCRDCHKGSLTQTQEHSKCTDCHADYHRKQFVSQGVSPDCADCHTVHGFSPSTYTIERHNQSKFPIEGAHLATPCFACHKTDARWNFDFANNKCTQCHDNFHEEALADKYLPNNDCTGCHSPSVWSDIRFNHEQTNYPLQGKHREVSCRSCHFTNDNDGLKQLFAGVDPSCINCHEDNHFKQFDKNGVTNCERCHVFTSWRPDKFDHNKTRFELDGKHVQLDCVSCHKLSDGLIEDYIVYKFNDVSCSSCH